MGMRSVSYRIFCWRTYAKVAVYYLITKIPIGHFLTVCVHVQVMLKLLIYCRYYDLFMLA